MLAGKVRVRNFKFGLLVASLAAIGFAVLDIWLYASNQSLELQITELRDDFQNQVNFLTSQVTSLQTEYDSLDASYNEALANFTSLQLDLNNMTNWENSLQAQVAVLRNQIGMHAYNDLVFEVSTDKSIYLVNETIKITMTITNPTEFEVTLNFTSGHQFDYTISSSQGQVYRWSDDKVFIDMLTNMTIQPHDSLIATSCHRPEDHSLEPGSYIIEGIIVKHFTDTTETTIV